eukprot:8236655-Lingulodinium_polyedra.AAC.1
MSFGSAYSPKTRLPTRSTSMRSWPVLRNKKSCAMVFSCTKRGNVEELPSGTARAQRANLQTFKQQPMNFAYA